MRKEMGKERGKKECEEGNRIRYGKDRKEAQRDKKMNGNMKLPGVRNKEFQEVPEASSAEALRGQCHMAKHLRYVT